jgi:hypothetical protein
MIDSSCKFTKKAPQGLYIGLIVITVAFLIILYGTYRCRTPTFEDPFTRSIIDVNPWNQFLDGWGLLHFWMYALLAFYFPSCWKEILFIGIIWEVIESLFKDHPFYLTKCDIEFENRQGWWYGRWEDIVMNSLGVAFGLWLFQRGGSKHILNVMLLVIVALQFLLQYKKDSAVE